MSLAETAATFDHLDDRQRDCLEDCLEAAEVCEWCADACLDEEADVRECVRLCRDVADVASLHARLLARDSNYGASLAEVCAGVCEECAEVCERHDHDHCQRCAEVVTACADSCRSMLDA